MNSAKQLMLGGLMALTAGASSASTFVGDRTDFRNETIYFMMTTRFYDGDPTNNVCSWDKQEVQISKNDPDWRGDFKGVIDKLDYIKALGFTAIWITPVVQNASGEDYHGYHAMDFSSVDLRYESRTEWGASQDVKFQDLIDAAHAKGIKVVLDVVLQHTGNFGEVYLNPLFTRSQNIKDQASVSASMIPNYDRLSSNYWDQDGNAQYAERWKYFKQAQYEPHNYYHHYGTGWNWDEDSRWWGQIAGDCVDLNTENDHVADYIVDCYGKFIEMGVDGFRIDTSGHISPLTFNTQFIPKFHEIAEANKSKRLNGGDFFMFGEVCQRFQGSVVYRDQPNLSSYFYTWKSDQSLIDEFKTVSSASYWDQQVLQEGHDTPVGAMAVCVKDSKDKARSNNVLMQNGQWHQPDYSQSSGFNVIDFPVHYSFSSVSNVMGLYSQDNYYNDASYNVVYVDSHDYCPGPNDGTRFNGGTSQWAENLSWMFTFRGIPCIYYGSEVEFKKGMPIDVGGENNKTPRSESGRAYFGNYLEGDVTASDFCTYSASGNVAETLNADLAQHIRRLNQIRAAVPALRTGQYTFEGCSANGGWAFKRATQDSYALVCVNGGATFSNVPAGTYVDLVTGKSYQGGGSITVDAPKTQGQLRVLVKDWTGGKVGEDGKFIYDTTPVAHGGSPTFSDPGTTQYYTADDAVGAPRVIFSPAGGTFKTETQTVTVSLSEAATSGWYQVAGKAKATLTVGSTGTFTIGEDMAYGQTVEVKWGATDATQEYTGSVTYKKVDPNAVITIYVKAPSSFNFYAWYKDASGNNVEPNGEWPGKELTETKEIGGENYYYFTFDDTDSANFIFNKNGNQTGNIEGVTEDSFYEYDCNTTYTKLDDVVVTPEPGVKLSPNGGTFVDNVTVTATANSNTTSAWYRIGNGAQVSFTGTTTFTIGDDMNIGDNVTVTWSATGAEGTKTGSATFTKIEEPDGITVYYDNSNTQWPTVYIYHWTVDEVKWPGTPMTKVADNIYSYVVPTGSVGMIFNNGNGYQSEDITNIINNHLYKGTAGGNKVTVSDMGEYTPAAVENVEAALFDDEPVYYNLQGIQVKNPAHGFFIKKAGNKVSKVYIP